MFGRGLYRRSKYAKRGQAHVVVNTPGGPQHFAASIPRDIMDYRSLMEIQTHNKPANKRARRYYWKHRSEISRKRRTRKQERETELISKQPLEIQIKLLKKKINATCLGTMVDHAVEKAGAACFASCPDPTNMTTSCADDCYISALIGNPEKGMKGMSVQEMLAPWFKAFADGPGACPNV